MDCLFILSMALSSYEKLFDQTLGGQAIITCFISLRSKCFVMRSNPMLINLQMFFLAMTLLGSIIVF